MDDLDEIKKKKLAEMQQQALNQNFEQQTEDQKIFEQIFQLEQMVKPLLDKGALSRYGNIKTAHPDKAIQLLVALAQVIQQSGLTKISDSQLKELLAKISSTREIKIIRK